MDMFEYSKTILNKVSFNTELLEMELEKAIRNISTDEGSALLEWCKRELGEKCGKIVTRRTQLLNKINRKTNFDAKN